MGKKDPCAVFECNNDRLFPEKYTVKDHISKTKLEKGDHYCSGTSVPPLELEELCTICMLELFRFNISSQSLL